MDSVLTQKRNKFKSEAIFPVILSDGTLGETIKIDNTGVLLELEKAPDTAIVSVDIKLLDSGLLENFEIKLKIIKTTEKNGMVLCNAVFLEPNEKLLSNLQLALNQYQSLSSDFIQLTKIIRGFLKKIRTESIEFDKQKPDKKTQANFIDLRKPMVFTKLDKHFQEIWEIAKNLDKQNYRRHQLYYQQMFYDLFGPNIEINWHIYRKPLGYSGDYLAMNYIYDYYKNKFLGNSTFEKLINHYTCNIPFSNSNIERKDFFRKQIMLEIAKKREKARILSVGSGPARELIELLINNEIKSPAVFTCFDFEEKALKYVRDEIGKVSEGNKKFITIHYVQDDVLNIIVKKDTRDKIANQDLIYVSGIFDYLGNQFCSRLTKQLFQLLKNGGTLIICNASTKNYCHRAYFEMLGEWKMFYRTEEEMLGWTINLKDASEIKFEDYLETNNYLFLVIRKS